jgi:hypothetical protein
MQLYAQNQSASLSMLRAMRGGLGCKNPVELFSAPFVMVYYA